MCAGKDYSVNLRLFGKELFHILLNKIIGPGRIIFLILNQRHPHGTCHRDSPERRKKFGNLDLISPRRYCTRCAKDSYVTVATHLVESFDGGDDHSEHPFLRINRRQIPLLD